MATDPDDILESPTIECRYDLFANREVLIAVSVSECFTKPSANLRDSVALLQMALRFQFADHPFHDIVNGI
jgi:hypothetical protein